MAPEPQPTPQDEWAAWDTSPERQSYWPGLGLEHKDGYEDGYEVDHARLQTIGLHLMTEFDDVYHLLHKPFHSGAKMDDGIMDWQAADTVSFLISNFEEALCCLTGDAMMECTAAAALVTTTGRSYEFADDHALRAKPSLWNGLPEGVGGSKGDYRVSNAYPAGTIGLLTPYENIKDPIADYITYNNSHHEKNRVQIREMLMSWKVDAVADYATATVNIANGLVEVAHAFVFRAQEIRDAPWRGPAADKAQKTLKQIFESVRGLAAVHGEVGLRTNECAEILRSAQHRFDGVVNKGGWEFSDLWNGDDGDAREFLTNVNRQLGDVMGRLPERALIDLPGLIPEGERDVYSLAW